MHCSSDGSQLLQQETQLLQQQEQQAEQVRAARAESDARIAAAKASIAQEAQVARQGLEAQSDALAGQIADAILSRRAA